ncbi:hypothetical protein IG631_24216 [Alternaria alternata]|nr:hypothetical protein IG631_24216 [Alternaria alternata]
MSAKVLCHSCTAGTTGKHSANTPEGSPSAPKLQLTASSLHPPKKKRLSNTCSTSISQNPRPGCARWLIRVENFWVFVMGEGWWASTELSVSWHVQMSSKRPFIE